MRDRKGITLRGWRTAPRNGPQRIGTGPHPRSSSTTQRGSYSPTHAIGRHGYPPEHLRRTDSAPALEVMLLDWKTYEIKDIQRSGGVELEALRFPLRVGQRLSASYPAVQVAQTGEAQIRDAQAGGVQQVREAGYR